MTSDIRSRCTVRDGDGDSIAVFGADAVDISAIMAAVTECTIIIGVDVKPNRLELARELGATHTINGAESEAVEEIGKHHRRRR